MDLEFIKNVFSPPSQCDAHCNLSSRLLKKRVHHKDTKAPRFRNDWFAWILDKNFFVSL
jgi:hypothetical protein